MESINNWEAEERKINRELCEYVLLLNQNLKVLKITLFRSQDPDKQSKIAVSDGRFQATVSFEKENEIEKMFEYLGSIESNPEAVAAELKKLYNQAFHKKVYN